MQTIAGQASSHGGRVTLYGVGERVSQVLGLTGLDQVLVIGTDVTSAKASFGTE